MKKLLNIQVSLNAPKNQRNNFGKYNYRSCEDILEAVKPLCKEHQATLIISDSVEMIGERYYIKATTSLYDSETGDLIAQSSAFARESQDKKGMDSAQVTGSTSSYARKYALNGLFNIDDTKDSDSENGNAAELQAKAQTKYMEQMKKFGGAAELNEKLKHSQQDLSKIFKSTDTKKLNDIITKLDGLK